VVYFENFTQVTKQKLKLRFKKRTKSLLFWSHSKR